MGTKAGGNRRRRRSIDNFFGGQLRNRTKRRPACAVINKYVRTWCVCVEHEKFIVGNSSECLYFIFFFSIYRARQTIDRQTIQTIVSAFTNWICNASQKRFLFMKVASWPRPNWFCGRQQQQQPQQLWVISSTVLRCLIYKRDNDFPLGRRPTIRF